jgi:carbon storage regulator CsrA
MLVLGRKPHQSIRIGDDVTVVVTRIGPGNRVSIGVVAPPHVAVVRTEIISEDSRDERPAEKDD